MKFVTTLHSAENTWTGECRKTMAFAERNEGIAEAKIWVDVQSGRRAPA
jgi:hypothetical protein